MSSARFRAVVSLVGFPRQDGLRWSTRSRQRHPFLFSALPGSCRIRRSTFSAILRLAAAETRHNIGRSRIPFRNRYGPRKLLRNTTGKDTEDPPISSPFASYKDKRLPQPGIPISIRSCSLSYAWDKIPLDAVCPVNNLRKKLVSPSYPRE